MSGPFDMDELLRQAMAMQQQLTGGQGQAAPSDVEGTAGGGAVRVTMTSNGEATAVHIDPAVVDPDDVELLEDLVLAALHDAEHRVAALQAERLGGLGGLGAFADLGGLAGLAGLTLPTLGSLDGPGRPGRRRGRRRGRGARRRRGPRGRRPGRGRRRPERRGRQGAERPGRDRPTAGS